MNVAGWGRALMNAALEAAANYLICLLQGRPSGVFSRRLFITGASTCISRDNSSEAPFSQNPASTAICHQSPSHLSFPTTFPFPDSLKALV